MIRQRLLYKKLIFCFLLSVNYLFSSFLPLVKTQWQEEVENSFPIVYVNKKGLVSISSDIENLILKPCDFDTLVNISMVNKIGKNAIGYFFYKNLADVYNMFKNNRKLMYAKKLKQYPNLRQNDIDESVQGLEQLFFDISAVKTNFNGFLINEKNFINDCCPWGALVFSSRNIVIDDTSHDFLSPYVQYARALHFDFFPDNDDYIEKLKNNTSIENLLIDCLKENSVFPDLSSCISLTSITISDHSDCDLEFLKNIPHLTSLNLPNLCMAYNKNKTIFKTLPQCKKLKNLTLDDIGVYKATLEKIVKYIEKINEITTLKTIQINSKESSIFQICLDYYKSKNKIPSVFIPYLKIGLISKWVGLWDENLLNAEISPYYDHLVRYSDEKKQEVRNQVIYLKEIPQNVQPLCDIIDAGSVEINLSNGNAENMIKALHNMDIQHAHIIEIIIHAKKDEKITLDAEFFSKYSDLHLSLNTQNKDYENQIFFLQGNNFSTITSLYTKDPLIMLENKQKFPYLTKFVYEEDFSYYNWDKKNKWSWDHVQEQIIYKTLSNTDALYWFEIQNQDRFYYSSLNGCTGLLKILFGCFSTITSAKIIKKLNKIQIDYTGLNCLRHFLDLEWNNVPRKLEWCLQNASKIKDVEDWKIVQEKYLPVIQEQIELKKPLPIIKRSISNFGSFLLESPKKIITHTFFNEMNFWRCVSFILLFLYIKEKRWIWGFHALFIKNKTVDVHA